MDRNTPSVLLLAQLNRIATIHDLRLEELTQIWNDLPIGDHNDLTYLEAANQCIIRLSELVDQAFPDLIKTERVSIKLKIMGQLLNLKAENLF